MQKSFAIIGLGRFGRSVARQLYNDGADVMVIDNDEEEVNKIADSVTVAISCDVTDTDALRNAGIGNMDAVIVSMADSLEPSIMCVMTAKDLGVPFVVAKARDDISGEIYTKVGADLVLYPEKTSGIQLAHRLMSNDFLDFFELSDTVSLIELMPKKEWVGKSLKQLNLRKEYKINVIAIKEENEVNVAMDPDEPLKAECPLLITVKKSDVKRLM